MRFLSDARAGWLTGIVLVGAAVACLLPLVSAEPGHSGDTMQFQVVADRYGVPHPLGAPAYVLMVHAWRRSLPDLSAAMAANLFSMVATVAALLVAWLLLRRWSVPGPLAALALGGLLASPLLLRLGAVAELYTPALAATLGVLLCLERWGQERRPRWLLGAGAVFGVGLGVHPQVVFVVAPAIALLVAGDRLFWRSRQVWSATVLAALLALAFYAVTVASLLAQATPFVWAECRDVGDVVSYFTARAMLVEVSWPSPRELWFVRLPRYTSEVTAPILWLLPAALIGLSTNWRRSAGVASLLLLLTNAAYVTTYSVWDAWDFVLPGQLALVLLAALGLGSLWRRARRSRVQSPAVAVAVALALIQVGQVPQAVRAAARVTHDPFWRQTAQHRLDLVGRGIIATDSWDHAAALWYETLARPGANRDASIRARPTVDELGAYLDGDAGLRLPQRRITVSPGHDLWVTSLDLADSLVASGRVVYDFGSSMYLVRQSEDPGLTARYPTASFRAWLPGAARWRFGEGFGPTEHWGRWLLGASGRIDVLDLPAAAVVMVSAATWADNQPPQRVEILLDGQVAASLDVATAPWQFQEFVVPLANPDRRARAALELRCAPFAAPGDIARGLAIARFEVRVADERTRDPERGSG